MKQRNAQIPPRLLPELRVRSRGYLPHWELEGATYSVTFRLDDSLPAEVLRALRNERRRIERQVSGDRKPSIQERFAIDRLFARELDRHLDLGHGECHLRLPEIASMVAGALGFFDGERYDLVAWCVMPNHVHAVLRPNGGIGLSEILHSWKSYSAREANRILGQTGRFWQREYFDRVVRDENELIDTVRYVLENPGKAGLKEWPWVGMGERWRW